MQIASTPDSQGGIRVDLTASRFTHDLLITGTQHSDWVRVDHVTAGGDIRASLGDEIDNSKEFDETWVQYTTAKSDLRVASGNGIGKTYLDHCTATNVQVLFGDSSGDLAYVTDCKFHSSYFDGDNGTGDTLIVLRNLFDTKPIAIRWEVIKWG